MKEQECMEKEDGDGVGQVEREGDDMSSRRPVRWEPERFEGVKAQREVGHASTLRRSCSGHAEMDSLGLKITMEADFPVWASKLRRTRGGRASGMEGTWHHRGAYFEAKGSREDGVSVRCSEKIWIVSPLHEQLS
jgi:hypothetical protein